MGATELLTRELVESQEQQVDVQFDAIVDSLKGELENLPFENTSLDTLKNDMVPNVIIYVDYAISGFSYRRIEIDHVSVLNADDEHLPRAEEDLLLVLEDIVYDLNMDEEAYHSNDRYA